MSYDQASTSSDDKSPTRTAGDPNRQLGLLDLSVDLSVEHVYSGQDFTVYLHIRNPFAQPVWIHSVKMKLPNQLIEKPAEVTGDVPDRASLPESLSKANEQLAVVIVERYRHIAELRKRINTERLSPQSSLSTEALDKLEEDLRNEERAADRQHSMLVAGGGVSVVDGGSAVLIRDARLRTSQQFLIRSDSHLEIRDSSIETRDQISDSDEVELRSSLPPGAALQPGSSDIQTIKLGTKWDLFFLPSKFKLNATVSYSFEPAGLDKSPTDSMALHTNATPFSLNVRAPLWYSIIGGALGSLLGGSGRLLQDPPAGASIGSVASTLALVLILGIATIIFSARKADTQTFVTVEDFWGGVLVGFLIGYSGTAAFQGVIGNSPLTG